MKAVALLALCILASCSREQTAAVSGSVTKTYLESSRDNTIKNWQAKVASTPACAEFKNRFQASGRRYDNAANGGFANDMLKIWEATKRAGCAAPV